MINIFKREIIPRLINVQRGTKEDLLRRLTILLVIDFLFFLFIAIFSKPRFWDDIKNPEWILISSVGMLTFISIFYSLIFSMTTAGKLTDLKSKINFYLKDVEENFRYHKQNTNDRKKLVTIIKRTNDEVNRIKLLRVLVRIDQILYFCVLLFTLSIYFYLVPYNLTLSSLLFLIGLILIFHIITAWVFVFQEEYNIRSQYVELIDGVPRKIRIEKNH